MTKLCLNECFDETGPMQGPCADPDNFLRGWGGGPASDQGGSYKVYPLPLPLDPRVPRVESTGQNLGHFKHLYSFICKFFMHFHNLDNH